MAQNQIPFSVQGPNAFVDAFVPTLDVLYGQGMSRGFVVTVAGVLSVLTASGNTILFPANAGTVYNLCTLKVNTTGTTATGILVLF